MQAQNIVRTLVFPFQKRERESFGFTHKCTRCSLTRRQKSKHCYKKTVYVVYQDMLYVF